MPRREGAPPSHYLKLNIRFAREKPFLKGKEIVPSTQLLVPMP